MIHRIVAVRADARSLIFASARLFRYRLFVTREIDDSEKPKRGRPSTEATPVMVRLSPDLLSAVDRWAASGSGAPSRPEAVRRLVAKGLERFPQRLNREGFLRA